MLTLESLHAFFLYAFLQTGHSIIYYFIHLSRTTNSCTVQGEELLVNFAWLFACRNLAALCDGWLKSVFSQDLIRGCHSTARREKIKKETKRKTRRGKAQCFSSTKSDNDLEDWAAGMVALTTFKLKPDLFARLPAETMAIDLAGVIAVRRRNWQDLCPGGGDGCWGEC